MNYFSIKYEVMCFKMNLSFVHYAFPILLKALDNQAMPKLTESKTSFANGRLCFKNFRVSVMCHCKGELKPKIELIKYLLGFSTHIWAVVGIAAAESFLWKLGNDSQRRGLTRMREILRRQFNDLLGDDGVFLFPPHPTVVPYHYQAVLTPLDCIYASFVNPLGLPSTSCPMGLDRNGLPLGVQIIGAENRDYLTIAVAEELGKVFGGWREPGRWAH